MGLIGGLVRFFLMRAVEITVILTILLFLPNIPPYCKFDTPYKVAPVKPLDGKLSLNEKLAGIEFWHQDSLQGAESFAAYNGELYTGLQTGEIVKLTGDKHISPIIQFGKPCKYFEEEKCGRPLGMVFDHTGALFVADAYYGIYKVDVKSGHKVQLVSPDVEINGKKPKLFNSVAVASSGEVYWTDSSTEFYLKDGVFDLLADGSGRVLKYDPKSKRNTVLIDGLHFANGIMLSQNEDFLVVAVTNRNEVLKYHLKGTKVGQYETLIGGLPGMPDNIRPDGHGGIILPLVGAHDADHPNVVQIFGPFPWMRKLIARGFGLLEFAFQMADRVYPNDYAKMGMHVVGHFSLPTQHPLHNRITVLHLSESGEILDSFHSTSGKAVGFSEAFIHNDYLLLGSPFNDFIGRISLKELGLRGLPTKPKVATTAPPKVTTTTTRPTTTTPPPTKAPTTKAPSTTTTTTPKPTTTKQPEKKQSPTTPKPAATTTTQKPVEKKEVPKAEAKKPTTTPKPATTTPKPATTTSKPATTTQKPVTTQKPTAKPKSAEQPKPAEKVAQKPIEEAKPPKQAEQPKAGKSSEAPSQNKV